MQAQSAAHPDEAILGADFSADPQHYLGYTTREGAQERFGGYFSYYWNTISAAVDAVFGEVLLWEGEPIAAAYHAISSGNTETAAAVWGGEVPYLAAVESLGDCLAEGYRSTVSFTQGEVRSILSAAQPQITLGDDPVQWITVESRSPSGMVLTAAVGDGQLSGTALRSLFSLRSANFTCSLQDGLFVFETLGYGHGVGLSQNGADYMARQGSDYRAILAHYYPGTTLTKQ